MQAQRVMIKFLVSSAIKRPHQSQSHDVHNPHLIWDIIAQNAQLCISMNYSIDDKRHHKRENVCTLFFSQFAELYIVI